MKKPVVIGLAVVVLAAVVAGGYWWYQSRQDNGPDAVWQRGYSYGES